MCFNMEWVLDPENNQYITINTQDLKHLRYSKLEGFVRHPNEHMHSPCSLEISQNGDSINGLSFKINKPVKYILRIRTELYERLSPGYVQEIILNKYDEILILRVIE